jgi:hypothetical protein
VRIRTLSTTASTGGAANVDKLGGLFLYVAALAVFARRSVAIGSRDGAGERVQAPAIRAAVNAP